MAAVCSIGTAIPPYKYSISDVQQFGDRWLSDHLSNKELFYRFVRASKVAERSFVMPPSAILSIGGMRERAAIFEEHAPSLGATAMQDALMQSDLNPHDLRSLIFTSCSCPSIPSVDALMIERLNLDRSINRTPIYQHGCAGGVVGLRLASELCKVQGPVAVTSVELCSLVFHRSNPTPAQLVGASIFADGAASVIVTPQDRGLVFLGSRSFLLPNSRHLMGYDVLDDGFHLKLDKHLPQALVEAAPTVIDTFLEHYDLDVEAIPYWLFHPGGAKILDFFDGALALAPDQAPWARNILSTVGNLSSATVMFVLKDFLDSKVCRHGDKVVMVGVGPGLTIETILFEWRDE